MCMFGNMFKTHFVAAVPLRKMPISSRKSGGFCHHIWIFLCGWWEEVDSSLERVIKTRKRGFPSWLESRAQAVRRERLWVLGRPAALILLAVEENQYLNLTVVLCTAYITWFKYQCLVSPGKCCGGRGKSGSACLVCCHRDPAPDLADEEGWTFGVISGGLSHTRHDDVIIK